MHLVHWLESLLYRQHGCPTGMVGWVIGERMVRQHAPETTWTLSLLRIEPTDEVLEIGFGAGRAIELAAAQAAQGHVVGVDLSSAMVRASRRRNAEAVSARRVKLLQGD